MIAPESFQFRQRLYYLCERNMPPHIFQKFWAEPVEGITNNNTELSYYSTLVLRSRLDYSLIFDLHRTVTSGYPTRRDELRAGVQ